MKFQAEGYVVMRGVQIFIWIYSRVMTGLGELNRVVRRRRPLIFGVGSIWPFIFFFFSLFVLCYRLPTIPDSSFSLLFLSLFTFTDQDTAEYLADVLPLECVVSPAKILSTLRQIHVKFPQMAFEERVKEALIMLGAPPPPTPP